MQLIRVYYQTFISTCFGHHYAHHQENKTVYYCIWCSALVVLTVVVWSWFVSCVHTVHTAYDFIEEYYTVQQKKSKTLSIYCQCIKYIFAVPVNVSCLFGREIFRVT